MSKMLDASKLDPARYKRAWLVDPTHKLPMGMRSARLFPPDGEVVDTHSDYWRLPLADGSLTLREPHYAILKRAADAAKEREASAAKEGEASAALEPASTTPATMTPAAMTPAAD